MSGQTEVGDVMIYLDNAATTWKKPPTVYRALTQAVRKYGNPGRSSHALSLSASEMIDDVRCLAAELIGAEDPSHIVFTMNATMALNLAIKTRIQRGGHILISDREHNAVYRPVCRLAREKIADFDVFSTRGNLQTNILSLLRENTQMLICNHVSNVDGSIAPIREIGELCRTRGIYFILDLSQSLGHIPFSLGEVCADAVCAPGHKGLFGVPGVGFVWLRDGHILREFLEGGSGSSSLSPSMPSDLPEKMEAGTLPTPAIAALGAGIRFLKKQTVEAVAAHEELLAARLCDRLYGIRGLHIYRGGRGGPISLCPTGITPDALTARLDAEGICVRGGLHCAPLAHAALGTQSTGTVRVSFSFFNTREEIDHFALRLHSLLP